MPHQQRITSYEISPFGNTTSTTRVVTSPETAEAKIEYARLFHESESRDRKFEQPIDPFECTWHFLWLLGLVDDSRKGDKRLSGIKIQQLGLRATWLPIVCHYLDGGVRYYHKPAPSRAELVELENARRNGSDGRNP